MYLCLEGDRLSTDFVPSQQSLSFLLIRISLVPLLFPSPCLILQIHHMIPGRDSSMSRSAIPGRDILHGASVMMISTLRRKRNQFVLVGMGQMILKILETGARGRNGQILSYFLSSRLSRKTVIFLTLVTSNSFLNVGLLHRLSSHRHSLKFLKNSTR